MSEDRWPVVGASFGIVAAVLLILSFLFTGSPPGFHDSAAEVKSFVEDNHAELQASVAFGFAALVAFLWFLGSVFLRLREAEPFPRLSATALAGGVALAAAGLTGTAAEGAATYHSSTLGADSVLALWDLSVFGLLFFLAGFTVLAAATGLLALRLNALPRGLGIYSLLAACYVFVVGVVASFTETGAFSPSDGALGVIAFLAFLIWLVATSLTLMRQPRAGARSPG
ncbi:MAG TPA: hypothetical protein VF009_02395 [Solirubrobacterales bacterium]